MLVAAYGLNPNLEQRSQSTMLNATEDWHTGEIIFRQLSTSIEFQISVNLSSTLAVRIVQRNPCCHQVPPVVNKFHCSVSGYYNSCGS